MDLVKISSVRDMLDSGGLAFEELCWTATELEHCDGSAPRLAARWAAKEATMKALGRGIGEIDPTDIEVTGCEGQVPGLRLHGTALALAERHHLDLALSMSHEDDFAIAFVVATPRSADNCERCPLEGANDGSQ
ncbi:holo-ACP synthase (plasmid) [Mycobacterium sp. SMC-8]|uniref:holo-ACP synthase n=1 Tax=Mycobacterium sp. SMC-8 TaxID=2857060 RepID=UPI0021B1698F|nr:holo-ACP synthase [Mycobacterium sp. SMC-8]UXA15851.1 holo-ACP synthase [Mycobacterium sp. SMC-8]